MKFKYLGATISTYGGMEEEKTHRLHEGRKIWRNDGEIVK